MEQPAPRYLELGRAPGARRRMIGGLWAIGACFAVAAFYRPLLLVFAGGLVLWLLAWGRLRRGRATLAVRADRLVLSRGKRQLEAERSEVASVRFPGSRGDRREMVVLDTLGRVLLVARVTESERGEVASALAACGWPVRG